MRTRIVSRESLVVLMLATAAFASEVHQQYHFKVRRHSSISIVNPYGLISVRPAVGNHVQVDATLYSEKVEVYQAQGGNHVSVASHLLSDADEKTGRVDYEVLVPADASVTLRTTSGPLRAEKLHGDLILEGNTAVVDVRDVSEGHVHVKTLNGPVTLTNVSNGHVEITSVSGDVALNAVNGPVVSVNSASGWIRYDGDFGGGGEYRLMTHTGDIEAIAPAYASIDVVASSAQGKVENDFPLRPVPHSTFVTHMGSAFAGTMGKAASSVKLLSFSGKIHLKKR